MDLPILGAIMALAVVIIGTGWRLRRLRARRRRPSRLTGSTPISAGDPPSHRERLIALSRAVREALVARFGPAWRSKTTEEIAREAGLTQAFGPEDAARLFRFLHEADRAKFAGDDEEGPLSAPSPDHGEEWVGKFLEAADAHSKGTRPETGVEETPSQGT